MMAAIIAVPVAAQQSQTQPVPVEYSYAQVADLALAATIVAHVRVRKAQRIPPELATGIAPGHVRYLITADVVSLIRGKDGVARRISYLDDLPSESRGKPTRIEKTERMVFAVAAPGESVRLARPGAQLEITPGLGALTRTIITEAVDPTAPPRVTGVAAAFHSEGALPGEGETQIFLNAEGDRPVSLTVVRTPNAPARWYVSLGEVVDQASGPPRRNTLLWYRLACFLPRAMPPSATADLQPAHAVIAKEDYATVMAGLGPCTRVRGG